MTQLTRLAFYSSPAGKDADIESSLPHQFESSLTPHDGLDRDLWNGEQTGTLKDVWTASAKVEWRKLLQTSEGFSMCEGLKLGEVIGKKLEEVS